MSMLIIPSNKPGIPEILDKALAKIEKEYPKAIIAIAIIDKATDKAYSQLNTKDAAEYLALTELFVAMGDDIMGDSNNNQIIN